LAGALDEDDALYLFAIGRALDRAAIGLARQGLETGLIDHIRALTRAEIIFLPHQAVARRNSALKEMAAHFG